MRHSLCLCVALVAGCNSSSSLIVAGDDLSPIPIVDAGSGDGATVVDLAVPPTVDMAAPIFYDFALPPVDLAQPSSSDLAVQRPLALRFAAPPYSVGAGQPFSIQVNVIDPGTGNVVTDVHPIISVKLGAATNPAGVLTGAVDRLPSNGTAQFDGLILDRWGQYTLIATAPGVASGESMPVRAQGTQVVFLVQPSTMVAHQPMSTPAKIAFEDGYGDVDLLENGTVGANILAPLGCTPSPYVYANATIVNGVGSFNSFVIDKACSGYKLQAGTSWSVQASQPFDVVFGAPVGLQLGPVTLPVRDTPFDLPVAIIDAGGNVVPTAAATTVTLSLPSGVSWSGPTTTTTTSGAGVFGGVVVDATGMITATATAAGLTSATYTLALTAWELRSTQSSYFTRIYAHPSNSDVLYALGNGVYRSTDGGKTFGQILATSVFDLAFDPSAPSTMYGATSTGVIKSTNGISFAAVPLRSDYYTAVAVDPSAPSNVWVATNKDVWRSSDGGTTWTGVTPALATSINALAIDGSGAVYAGGDTVRRTSDGGATWTTGVGLPANGGWNSITVDPLTAGRIYTCNGSYCYASADSGGTWLNLGHASARIVVDPNTPDTVYASNGYNGLAKSRDGGASWLQLPFPNYNFIDLAAARSSSGELYALTYGYSIYRTLTAGE